MLVEVEQQKIRALFERKMKFLFFIDLRPGTAAQHEEIVIFS